MAITPVPAGYVLDGSADGPLVVVLDGASSRGLGSAAAADAEALGIRLLVPGGRDDDVPALVRALGFRRFGIVARSGATPHALELAAVAGDAVTGVALVDGVTAPIATFRTPSAYGDVLRHAAALARQEGL
jgi:pimeloyl-ACP methyl ester carboxylesterase